MNKKLIVILAHQDDEFGVFNRISSFSNKKDIFIFYMTSGVKKILSPKKNNFRDLESIKVLNKLGVKEKNIFFIGRKLLIKTNRLYLKMDLAYNELFKNIKDLKGKKIIYSHSLEGGHEDHDACYYLTKKILCNLNTVRHVYQFPLYHGKNLPFIFFRVLNPILENGKVIKRHIRFKDRLRFIFLLFLYRSQIKVWIGLYPFIIFKYLFYRNDSVQTIKKDNKVRRPHYGKLLYEKRGFCKYIKFESKILKFMRK